MVITPDEMRTTPSLAVIGWSGESWSGKLTFPPMLACAASHKQGLLRQRYQGEAHIKRALDVLCSAEQHVVKFVGTDEIQEVVRQAINRPRCRPWLKKWVQLMRSVMSAPGAEARQQCYRATRAAQQPFPVVESAGWPPRRGVEDGKLQDFGLFGGDRAMHELSSGSIATPVLCRELLAGFESLFTF
jgi:hypothetical protein